MTLTFPSFGSTEIDNPDNTQNNGNMEPQVLEKGRLQS